MTSSVPIFNEHSKILRKVKLGATSVVYSLHRQYGVMVALYSAEYVIGRARMQQFNNWPICLIFWHVKLKLMATSYNVSDSFHHSH